MRSQLRAVETELKEQQRQLAKSEAKGQDLTTRLTRYALLWEVRFCRFYLFPNFAGSNFVVMVQYIDS